MLGVTEDTGRFLSEILICAPKTPSTDAVWDDLARNADAVATQKSQVKYIPGPGNPSTSNAAREPPA